MAYRIVYQTVNGEILFTYAMNHHVHASSSCVHASNTLVHVTMWPTITESKGDDSEEGA